MPHAPTTRRVDVDWLRVGATYLLFLFHAALVFSPAPFFHVRNGELSTVLMILAGFISLWHMPLFFLLAGWSIVASVRARGGMGFVRERLLRLGVPLLVGCLFLMPPIKYLELASGLDLNHRGLFVSPALQDGFRRVIPGGLPEAAPFHETFLEFLPTFYTELDRFTWAHLWFVAYLLTFTLLHRPLIGWMLARRTELAGIASAWIYAPIVPLVLVQLVLRPHWPGIQNLYDDWANVGYYSVFLLGGVALARWPTLEEAVVGERWRVLGIASVTTLLLLLTVLGVVTSPVVALAGSGIAAWCFVVALVGFARGWSLPDGPVLAYLAESALPVYVLHQLALVVIGYWVVGLSLGVAAKYALLVTLALGATLAVYHGIVRPLPPLRFAFGMRPRVCPLPAKARGRAAAAALIAAVLAGAASASAATPVGRCYAEGGAAQVEVRACGDALCGTVVWLRAPFDEHGCPLRDEWNPDPALRNRPVEGREILHGLVRTGADGAWTDGRIYDPTTARTYRATLALDGDDRALLRGYLGIPLLGRTTTWVRVGREEHRCRMETNGERRP